MGSRRALRRHRERQRAVCVDGFGSGVVLRVRGVVVVRTGPPVAGVIYGAGVSTKLDGEEHEEYEREGNKD